jgi:hypothetical protein
VRPEHLWQLLAGERGFVAMSAHGRSFFVPVADRRSFVRKVDAWSDVLPWSSDPDVGDLAVGAVPYEQANYLRNVDSHVLWARAESPAARAKLAGFDPAPTVTFASGSVLTALWGLTRGLDPEWTERLNRRVAHELGCKKKWCSTGFMFAPAGVVLRQDRLRPVPVVVRQRCSRLYGAREVAGRLREAPDPDAWRNAA